MKKTLLKHIVCPYCKGKFKVHEFGSIMQHNGQTEWREVIAGYLQCSCRWYPIIKSVPRILPDAILWHVVQDYYPGFLQTYKGRLPPIPKQYQKGLHHRKKTQTLKGFGYEWKKFPTLYRAYTQQFLSWISPVHPEFFKGKLVLDAGCGIGRHLYHSTLWGAETIGIDLSEAVEVACENTKMQEKTHLIQADIYHLPLRNNNFDYIYCIGVLHHLPNPKKGFESLAQHLKPKKHISLWVYGREQNYLLKVVDPIRKYILSRLPLRFNLVLSYAITLVLYPLIKLIYRPMNKNKSLRKIAEYLPQNPFFNYLSQYNFLIIHSIVFDQMLAPVAFYCSKEEVLHWYNHAGIKVLNISWRNQNSWRAFGIKE